MSDDTVTIEINGVEVEARKGEMIIEVTDRTDDYVPRFCYHSKLSIAANCRMCLVEVEKAPEAAARVCNTGDGRNESVYPFTPGHFGTKGPPWSFC